MSVLLGSSADEAVSMVAAGTAGDIAERLRDPRKAVRAQALAVVVAEVKLALDEGTLR